MSLSQNSRKSCQSGRDATIHNASPVLTYSSYSCGSLDRNRTTSPSSSPTSDDEAPPLDPQDAAVEAASEFETFVTALDEADPFILALADVLVKVGHDATISEVDPAGNDMPSHSVGGEHPPTCESTTASPRTGLPSDTHNGFDNSRCSTATCAFRQNSAPLQRKRR